MPEASLNISLKVKDARRTLKALANPEKAKILSSFFKTAHGQYGYGDVFLGVMVPQTRATARAFHRLPVEETLELLHSRIHEERLLALLILVDQFKKGGINDRQAIYNLYLSNTRHINNWDLVDLSAPQIIGGYLIDKDRSLLTKLSDSRSLWERRMAILATFPFIKNNDLFDTFRIAERLLTDKHDLIHKAVGWMLREAGKRNQEEEEKFLKIHYKCMPRTMLRYAIERFEETKRQNYLQSKI